MTFGGDEEGINVRVSHALRDSQEWVDRNMMCSATKRLTLPTRFQAWLTALLLSTPSLCSYCSAIVIGRADTETISVDLLQSGEAFDVRREDS